MYFIYNAEKRTVDIYTMEYLVTTYATRLNYTDKEYERTTTIKEKWLELNNCVREYISKLEVID